MFFNPAELTPPANFANLLICEDGATTGATTGATAEISKLAELAAPLAAENAANEPETGIPYATAEQLADDRRTCRRCRNLAGSGECQAARRGELPLTSRKYQPDPDRLERCIAFSPTAEDIDQRPGRERFPGLYRRLWAMQEQGR